MKIAKMKRNIQDKDVQNKSEVDGICLPSQLKTRLSSVFVTIVGIWGGIFCVRKVITIVLGVGSG